MKKILALAFLLLTGASFAQLTPEFEFQLYFEDAVGNKDTITLGYDPLATDTIDTAFGEVNILNQAWGDSLDVRIGDLVYHFDTFFNVNNENLNTNSYLSKKTILNYSCTPNFTPVHSPNRITIQVKSNSYPIKIKWNSLLFKTGNYNCRYVSSFFGREDYLNLDASAISELATIDSIYIKQNNQMHWYELEEDYGSYTYKIPLNNYLNNPYLSIIQFAFLSVGTSNISLLNQNDLKIFPNPVSSSDELNITANGHYKIIDMIGQVLQEGEIDANKIQLKHCKTGMYILQINKTHNLSLFIK